MDKQTLRQALQNRREQLDPEQVVRSSESLCGRVLASDAYVSARHVFCFLSTPREPQTDGIIRTGFEQGKHLCVPAYDRERAGYRPVVLTRDAVLVKDRFGLMEPEQKEWISMDEPDLALVPGVVFDATGGRLGHGGGYYDRILSERTRGPFVKIGLAFAFQVVARVPQTETDVRVDMIITENETIRCERTDTRKEK